MLLVRDDGRVYAGCREFANVDIALAHWRGRDVEFMNRFRTYNDFGIYDADALRSSKRACDFIAALNGYKAEMQ